MKIFFKRFGKTEKKELNFAYFCLLLFGTLGIHQFYLENKKKAYFLLVTTGISNSLLLAFMMTNIFKGFSSTIENTIYFFIALGFVIGAPEWLVDLFTLSKQVKKINIENGFTE